MMNRTHTGDLGTTDLPARGRVPKHDVRIAFLGTMDEVDSVLGLAIAHGVPAELRAEIHTLQRFIFRINSLIALGSVVPPGFIPTPEEMLAYLDALTDRLSDQLPPLHTFIYPGGCPAAASIHVARAVCRRAERVLWELHAESPVHAGVLAVVNRMSLALYLLARACNVTQGVPEEEVEGSGLVD
jgi:cob(I)alamin adenosyltransferase